MTRRWSVTKWTAQASARIHKVTDYPGGVQIQVSSESPASPS